MGTTLSDKNINQGIQKVRNNHIFYQRQISNVLKLVKPNKKDVILDIGCCTGKYEVIISHTCKIVGVEIDLYAIRKAKEYCEEKGKKGNWEILLKNKSFVEMFKHNQFTKIMMIDIIEHCEDKELIKIFFELRKICSEQTKVLIYTPNRWHYTQLISGFTTPEHINVKTATELKEFVEKQGLEVKEVYFVGRRLPFCKKRICLKAKLKEKSLLK